MAAKRFASNDLNHNNWDQEDEPEEAGTFKKASEETIKNRVIKTARRRNPIGSITSGDGDKKNAFGNFAGFNKSSQNTNTSFSFLTNLTSKTEQPKTNGLNKDEKDQTFKSPENKSVAMSEDDKSDKSNEYYAKLKGLNESVSNWIKKHVDANPLINLQPIFRDYEKYLDELEKSKNHTQANSSFKFTPSGPTESNKKSDETSKSIFASSNTVTSTSGGAPNFNFNASASTPTTFTFGLAQTSGAPTFSFGKPMATASISATTSSASPMFTFGNKTTPSTTSAGFTFGTNTTRTNPIVFGATTATATTSSEEATKEDDENDEPPKVEFTPVVEEGHVYTTRCKVFVKKDTAFSDRGVGKLYLKPVPNSEKTQLIVRADTNLGNLLLNLILSKTIPLQRMGKKDVMMVCLPTPDSKPPPAPILLRVKSPEEADALLDILKKYQK